MCECLDYEDGDRYRCVACAPMDDVTYERARVFELALQEIIAWSQELQDSVERNGDGIAMWRGCIGTALVALRKFDMPPPSL